MQPTGGLKAFGRIRSITGTDPAAGSEISEPVPTGKVWRIRAIRITLVTNETVATRCLRLVFDDGTSIFYKTTGNLTQAATLTYYYSFGIGAPRTTAGVGTEVNISEPLPEVLLAAGFRVRTITEDIQAGDDYGAPIMDVEEFDA